MLTAACKPAGVLGDLLPGDLNDACCWACSGGGDVVCCDGCRAVYHLACINLQSLPDEDWFCPLCSCKECQGPCKTPHQAISVKNEMIPVHTKSLQARQSPQAKLPDNSPGYVCPQQMRLWLQQQPTAVLEVGPHLRQQELSQGPGAGTKAADQASAEADATADQQPLEPRPKRQKRDPVVVSSSSSNPSAAAADSSTCVSSDTYIRCCCCQRRCHVSCLPPEQQQHVATWAADATHCADRDQHKSTRSVRRIRSPKQKKQQQQAKQDEHEQQQQLLLQAGVLRPMQPYFCSPGCKQTATELAKQCSRGVVQLEALADGTPVCWQLIQPAAVAAALAAATPAAAAAAAAVGPAAGPADPAEQKAAAATVQLQAEARSALAAAFTGAAEPPPAAVPAVALVGTGVAPLYSQVQAAVLAQVLRDTQQLMSQQLGPAWEVRTYQHTLPWLLSGLRQVTPGGLLDLSHFHVATLWVGSTLTSAALLRVHGGEAGGVLEVTLAATSQQLQHRRLGRLLVGAVERFAMRSCKVKQAWMPALGGVVKPCVGVSVLPAWEREDGTRDRLRLAPGCSTKLLGLDVTSGSSPAAAAATAAAAGRRRQAAEEAAQKVPKGVAACWALKLSYGRAANVTDWLLLTKCPLLRFSYVPFVSKHLEQHTMLPVPHFRRQQPSRPPPLPPLPPQMPLQPRFAMPPLLPPPHLMQQRPLLPMQQQQTMPLGRGAAGGFAGMAPALPPGGLLSATQPADTAATAAAPGAAEAGGNPQQQQQQQHVPVPGLPPGVVSSQMPHGTAAHMPAGAADLGSGGEQQQQQSLPGGVQAEATDASQQQQPQQQQATQRVSPAAQAPVSKRQQWKEQVMQQFLAQQRGFRPTHSGQPAAAVAPAAAGSAAAAEATAHVPAAKDAALEADAQQ